MDIEVITNTVTSATQSVITEPITGQAIEYQQSLTTGDVITGSLLLALVVYLLYVRIMVVLKGR